jgi:RNA polymerase sigma-70 factor (ECF subfamily)
VSACEKTEDAPLECAVRDEVRGTASAGAREPSPARVSELIARARRGDVAAFEELYRSHVGRVYAVCLRLHAHREEAEDSTQEAFVRAWQRIESFEGRSAFSTWLHRLAVNVVLDRKRVLKRRFAERLATVEEEERDPVMLARARPSDPVIALDLERAIASLPDGARAAFVLHDVEGFRHREIAEMLGTAEGTSKAQLHRARRLLREALER